MMPNNKPVHLHPQVHSRSSCPSAHSAKLLVLVIEGNSHSNCIFAFCRSAALPLAARCWAKGRGAWPKWRACERKQTRGLPCVVHNKFPAADVVREARPARDWHACPFHVLLTGGGRPTAVMAKRRRIEALYGAIHQLGNIFQTVQVFLWILV